MARVRAPGPRPLLALLLALWGAAHAEGVRVSPMIVQLAPRQASTEVWLNNALDHPWHAQVQVYRWRQPDGSEQLQATDEVHASPQWISIPAHGRQLVRLVRTEPTVAAHETAYRLILEERSAAPADDGAALLLRYSTPVFLSAPGTAAAPVLGASLVPGAHGPELLIRNRGSAHARLSDLRFIGVDGRSLSLSSNLAGYVLAGEQKRWPLPPAATAPGGRFAARLGDQAPLQLLPAD